MNKFIPENSATVEYNEAFYLRTKFIVAIAVLSAVVPFIGVIVALLIGLKGKNFSSYRKQLENLAPRTLAATNDKAQKIIDEAMWQAEQNKRDARRELDRIQAEINKHEFYLSEVKRVK